MGDVDSFYEAAAFAFTPARIKAAIAFARSSTKPRHAWRDDSKESSHLLLVVGRKSATFFHRARKSGKLKTTLLGPAEGPAKLTLHEARERCGAIQHGAALRPRRDSRSPRVGLSLDQVWAKYLREVTTGTFSMRKSTKKRPLAPKTIRGYRSNYEAHLSGRYGASDFGKFLAGIVETIREIASRSPALGNQVLAVATALVEYARRRGIYEGENPLRAETADVRSFVERREILLKDQQLRDLVASIEAEDEFWRDLFTLLLITANRLSNIAQLTWDQVDFEAGVIIHAGSTMKAKITEATKITPRVAEILKRRQQNSSGSVFVFPNRRDPAKAVKNPHTAWDRIRERAGLPDVPIHGLKHIAVTLADREKVPSRIVQAFAKHRHAQTTAVYSHLDAESSGIASNAVTAALDRIVKKASD
jgi:integrase